MQVSSLLTAGMAKRGSSSTGQKGHELLGLIRKFTQLHCPKVLYTELFSHTRTSDNHNFTSTMFGWNTGKGLQQNPAGAALSEMASQREQWPPNLQYYHPDPTGLLRWVRKLPSWGDYEKKKGGFFLLFLKINSFLSVLNWKHVSMVRAALKKPPQILYLKKTFFRHARRYCRKKKPTYLHKYSRRPDSGTENTVLWGENCGLEIPIALINCKYVRIYWASWGFQVAENNWSYANHFGAALGINLSSL